MFIQSQGYGKSIGGEILKIVEVKCEKCSKKIYIQENYKREKMFCTLGCMDSYKEEGSHHKQSSNFKFLF